jgi:translation initiation factor 1 (eIF-1/SUI1)
MFWFVRLILFKPKVIRLSLSEDYDTNSIDNILRELDREKTNVIISEEIRRYKKSTTIVRGLQDRTDKESITRELKTKLGTGGTYIRKDKLFCKVIIGNQLRVCLYLKDLMRSQ